MDSYQASILFELGQLAVRQLHGSCKPHLSVARLEELDVPEMTYAPPLRRWSRQRDGRRRRDDWVLMAEKKR